MDFLGDVFRASTAGATERNSYALDWVYALIGYVRNPYIFPWGSVLTCVHDRSDSLSGGSPSMRRS